MHLTSTAFFLAFIASLVAAAPLSWSESTFEEINALRARGIPEKELARMHPMISVPDHSHPVQALTFSETYSKLSLGHDGGSIEGQDGLRGIARHFCGGVWALLGRHDEDAAARKEQVERLELRGLDKLKHVNRPATIDRRRTFGGPESWL